MECASRVLLVDDESKILDALQRILRPLRETWCVVTATSARVALELLDRDAFDVVVSDMRMPEMDGAALLSIVKEKFPATARVILSGQTEKTAALRAVPVAHQFLHKPCPPNTLIELLSRRTKFPLSNLALRQRIGAIDSLPCDPEIAQALYALVSESDVRLDAVIALVKKEPVLILKLLQLSNSSFFGIKRQSDDVDAAVSFAGIELLQALATSARESSAAATAATCRDLQLLRAHAVEVACVAKAAAGESPHADACFVAGMLHEIGKIVLVTHAPEMFDAITARALVDGCSFEAAEAAEGVVSHATIGAALLDLWGLPQAVVNAVADQSVAIYESEYLDPTAAVRLAHRRIAAPKTVSRE